MQTSEFPRYAVQKVKLSGDEREKLLEYLCSEHDAALQERQDDEARWEVWHKQANSRLERKGAGPKDSNIDMGLTRERFAQNSARLQTPILQQDPIMVGVPREPALDDLAKQIEKAADWALDRTNVREWCDEWIEQFQTFNVGVVKTPFIYQTDYIKFWDELKGTPPNEALGDPGMSPQEQALMLQKGGETVIERKIGEGPEAQVKYFREAKKDKTRRTGAFPVVVPIEDFIFPTGAADIYSTPWVTHRLWLTEKQVAYRIKRGDYEKTIKNQSTLELLKGMGAERKRYSYAVEDPEAKKRATNKQLDIRETYICWPVKGKEVELIVTWNAESKAILSIVENFLHEYYRPFVCHQYKHVHGSIYGTPLSYILEPFHRAYMASINQRLDQASLANEVAILAPTGHSLHEQADGTFRGGIYVSDAGKDEIQVVRLTEPGFSQLPSLEGVIETRADRAASLTDASFGDETVNRPTATGTMQLIEESKQPQYLQLERFRESFAEVVRHMLARYKQFYPEGMKLYLSLKSDEERKMLEEFSVNWPVGSIEDHVLVETKVSSATMSKNARKQELVALMDKMPQLQQTLFQFASMATTPNPQAPATMLIAVKLLTAFHKVVDMFMVEFDVPNKQVLNPPLAEEAQVYAQINQQFMELQQQLQMLQQQNAQLQAQLSGQPPQGPPQGGMVNRQQASLGHRDLTLWLEALENQTMREIINSKGEQELLELKGRLFAYHKVLSTITAPVKEID
jgi:hypothetical protein